MLILAAPFHRSCPQRQSVRKTPGPETEPEAPQRRRTVKQGSNITSPEVKMMVVWLESFEDHLNFPIGTLTKAQVARIIQPNVSFSIFQENCWR